MTVEDPLTCKECGRIFDNIVDLAEHKRSEEEGRKDEGKIKIKK